MTTPPAIKIDNLVKRYAPNGPGDEGKLALKGVSFDVPQGGVFGLLGPNGAGKSTLINILAGLVRKTSGNAEIWGFDIDDNPRNAKRSIGIVPQEIVFDPFFTPFEVLENQGGFYGIPKAERRSEDLTKRSSGGIRDVVILLRDVRIATCTAVLVVGLASLYGYIFFRCAAMGVTLSELVGGGSHSVRRD